MKIPTFALAVTAALAMSPFTYAGSSAKQAIETLKTAEGTNTVNQIVGLTGRFGQDQPQEWEILARRGDQFSMFIVDDKSVISISKVRTRTPVRLNVSKVKVDSTKAFRIVDKSAKKASIGFDSLKYVLKSRDGNRAPVWVVSLADYKGITVGEVHVAADSGSILLTNWDREQLNRPKNVPGSPGNRGIIADRRGSSVQTSSTVDGVRDGLASVGNSIRNVFRRGEVSNPDQQKAPKTTKTRPN